MPQPFSPLFESTITGSQYYVSAHRLAPVMGGEPAWLAATRVDCELGVELAFAGSVPFQDGIHVSVEHRCEIERDQLSKYQAAYDAEAEGTARFGAGSESDGDGQCPHYGGRGSHHDGTEAGHRSLVGGLDRRVVAGALQFQCEIHHHDGVLLD